MNHCGQTAFKWKSCRVNTTLNDFILTWSTKIGERRGGGANWKGWGTLLSVGCIVCATSFLISEKSIQALAIPCASNYVRNQSTCSFISPPSVSRPLKRVWPRYLGERRENNELAPSLVASIIINNAHLHWGNPFLSFFQNYKARVALQCLEVVLCVYSCAILIKHQRTHTGNMKSIHHLNKYKQDFLHIQEQKLTRQCTALPHMHAHRHTFSQMLFRLLGMRFEMFTRYYIVNFIDQQMLVIIQRTQKIYTSAQTVCQAWETVETLHYDIK